MSRSLKVTAIIIGLLGLMVLSQYATKSTLEDITANKPRSSTDGKRAKAPEKHESVKLPDPTGPASAPVKIKAYVTSDNSCDTSTLSAMKTISNKYGAKVRIEYVDLLKKEVANQAQQAKLSCKSGLTINGMSVMNIPGHGVKGLVMFDGPVGEKNYNLNDIDAAVSQLLKTGASKGTKSAKASKGS